MDQEDRFRWWYSDLNDVGNAWDMQAGGDAGGTLERWRDAFVLIIAAAALAAMATVLFLPAAHAPVAPAGSRAVAGRQQAAHQLTIAPSPVPSHSFAVRY